MAKLALVLTLFWVTAAYSAQDPTAPLGWEPTPTKARSSTAQHRVPTLQSIVCAEGGDCYAIVDQKIVAQGDMVNGYRVAAIRSDQVKLTRAGKVWQLALFALDIKK